MEGGQANSRTEVVPPLPPSTAGHTLYLEALILQNQQMIETLRGMVEARKAKKT